MNSHENTSDKKKLIQRVKKIKEQVLNLRLTHLKDKEVMDNLSELRTALDDVFSIIKERKK